MQYLIGGPVRQECPGAAGLGACQAQGCQDLLRGKVQQFGTGRSCPKGARRAGYMPTLVPVAGNPKAHANPAHHLVAADYCLQQFIPGLVKHFCQAPGRRHYHCANMGFGTDMHIIQFQGMPLHGVKEYGGAQVGPFRAAPNGCQLGAAAFLHQGLLVVRLQIHLFDLLEHGVIRSPHGQPHHI